MAKNILITGASGLIGKKLIPALQAQGHKISILSRRQISIKDVNVFLWDVYNQTIDPDALKRIDTVINLAGEGIADKKWTNKRKQEIIDSRVMSAQLLYKTIQETKAPVSTFISASAVGFYGDRGDEVLTEKSDSGNDFLSQCCVKWEDAANQGKKLGIRVVKIRIGLILSKDGGVLKAMEKPIKFFFGAPLGSGKQWMPWIHLNDIIKIFTKAVEDSQMVGAYNACAPFPVTNKSFTKTIAKKLNRPVWPVHVPKFVLNTILGEMSILPLMSSNTMVQKLLDTGYKFDYVHLDDALNSIYTNS
ncbi:TIGR01777 family oxidoreductase [Pedobacter boryungensis]|uniref:TIGR01777 family protein n=1 Tax=Pedobacter boryungensis TaxID=869962 RepID=A0ABX2DDG1_9SPHI|nr:TIGR01777 family oxidoreductase [Pedobacter boryungensis]NQX32050.1 TIGR01777 family protein [Pedobacter boryungensis]